MGVLRHFLWGGSLKIFSAEQAEYVKKMKFQLNPAET